MIGTAESGLANHTFPSKHFHRNISIERRTAISHIVRILTQIREPLALQAACRRLQLPEPVFGETKIFSGTATGWAVQLPDWRYPVVCDLSTTQIAYDNFEGRWGNPVHLDLLQQAYAVEVVKLRARRQGQTAIEQPLENGSIRVQIAVAN